MWTWGSSYQVQQCLNRVDRVGCWRSYSCMSLFKFTGIVAKGRGTVGWYAYCCALLLHYTGNVNAHLLTCLVSEVVHNRHHLTSKHFCLRFMSFKYVSLLLPWKKMWTAVSECIEHWLNSSPRDLTADSTTASWHNKPWDKHPWQQFPQKRLITRSPDGLFRVLRGQVTIIFHLRQSHIWPFCNWQDIPL